MNKKQCTFLRKYARRTGKLFEDLKRQWNVTPRNERQNLKKQFQTEIEIFDSVFPTKS